MSLREGDGGGKSGRGDTGCAPGDPFAGLDPSWGTLCWAGFPVPRRVLQQHARHRPDSWAWGLVS